MTRTKERFKENKHKKGKKTTGLDNKVTFESTISEYICNYIYSEYNRKDES